MAALRGSGFFGRGGGPTDAEWDAAIDAFPRRADRAGGTDRWLPSGDPEVCFERAQFLEAQPWRSMRARLDQAVEREATRSRLNWTLGFSGLGLAVSVAVLLVVFAFPPADPVGLDRGEVPTIRSKGGAVAASPTFGAPQLHVRVDGSAVVSGEELTPGSELVFSVDTEGYDHVLVFGVEESGTITPYYPDDARGRSLMVGRGRGLGLPDSVVLDDAVGQERLVAIFSNRPLTWARVHAAATEALEATGVAGMRPLGIPETGEASIWFVKRQ